MNIGRRSTQLRRRTKLVGFAPILETSLALIEPGARTQSAAIIDVGGGASTLVDDLIVRGYRNLTLLDVSEAPIEIARRELHHTPFGTTQQFLYCFCTLEV